jgi:hypothetical protein
MLFGRRRMSVGDGPASSTSTIFVPPKISAVRVADP